jgi:hypothetical protein
VKSDERVRNPLFDSQALNSRSRFLPICGFTFAEASKRWRLPAHKQTKHPIELNASGAGFQLLKHVSGVDARSNKARAFLGHAAQESHPALVNEGDLTQIDGAGLTVLRTVPVFPACPQFTYPWLN